MEAYKFKKSLQIVGREGIDQNPQPTPRRGRIPTISAQTKKLFDINHEGVAWGPHHHEK